MTREQNQLIKKIRNLSPEDVARVLQFLQQPKSPELRAVPMELKAVPNGMSLEQVAQTQEGEVQMDAANPSPQAPQEQDLQPIAALFREAVDTRAASRFRYGSR